MDDFELLQTILKKIQKDGRIDVSKMEFNDLTEDLIYTFVEYMKSRCLIRLNPMYHSHTVYSFSKPGYNFMRQEGNWHLFIANFLDKYRDCDMMFEKKKESQFDRL